MPRPSKAALANIGEPIVWDQTEPRRRHVDGICIGVEATGSTIENADGRFPGVRFLIKPAKGRAVWTCTFPDTGHDLPEDIGP